MTLRYINVQSFKDDGGGVYTGKASLKCHYQQTNTQFLQT